MALVRTSWTVCLLSVAAALGGLVPILPAAAGPNQGRAVSPSLVTPPATSGDACVNRGLTVVKGTHVLGATRGDTPRGSAVVRFDSNITRCVYVATIGLCGVEGVEEPVGVAVLLQVGDSSG